jgi:hypothetical protein
VVKTCPCVGEWKSLAFDSMKRLKFSINMYQNLSRKKMDLKEYLQPCKPCLKLGYV